MPRRPTSPCKAFPCTFKLASGKQCSRIASCRIGCKKYCWQHAEVYKKHNNSKSTCIDGGGKIPKENPSIKQSSRQSQIQAKLELEKSIKRERREERKAEKRKLREAKKKKREQRLKRKESKEIMKDFYEGLATIDPKKAKDKIETNSWSHFINNIRENQKIELERRVQRHRTTSSTYITTNYRIQYRLAHAMMEKFPRYIKYMFNRRSNQPDWFTFYTEIKTFAKGQDKQYEEMRDENQITIYQNRMSAPGGNFKIKFIEANVDGLGGPRGIEYAKTLEPNDPIVITFSTPIHLFVGILWKTLNGYDLEVWNSEGEFKASNIGKFMVEYVVKYLKTELGSPVNLIITSGKSIQTYFTYNNKKVEDYYCQSWIWYYIYARCVNGCPATAINNHLAGLSPMARYNMISDFSHLLVNEKKTPKQIISDMSVCNPVNPK